MAEDPTWNHEFEVAKKIAAARQAGRDYLGSVESNVVEQIFVHNALDRALEVLRPYIVVPPPTRRRWWHHLKEWLDRVAPRI